MLFGKKKNKSTPSAKELIEGKLSSVESDTRADTSYALSINIKISKLCSAITILGVIVSNLQALLDAIETEGLQHQDIELLEKFLDKIVETDPFKEYLDVTYAFFNRFKTAEREGLAKELDADYGTAIYEFIDRLDNYLSYKTDVIDFVNSVGKEFEIDHIKEDDRYNPDAYIAKQKVYLKTYDIYTSKIERLNKEK